jgi:hypothetical protein
MAPSAALAEAQRLLDTGHPFEAHEVLEAVWKAAGTPAAQQDLWRGLAQLAVGITHALRGNAQGAATLLHRAADSLAGYDGTTPCRVDVAGLREWAAGAADTRRVTPPPRLVVDPIGD